MTPTERIRKVTDCPRCGGEHEELFIFPLPGKPIKAANFFATCPATGAPLLITLHRDEVRTIR